MMRLRQLCSVLALTAFPATALKSQGQNFPPPVPLITQPINEALRTPLPRNIHPLARPEFDNGQAPADMQMERMLLVLKRSPEQQAALETLLQEQQNVSSPSYHQWLTPEQFGQRFGPAASDINTVTQWLAAHGLQVSQVSRSGLFVEFSGSVNQVSEAFGTSIHSYLVDGQQHWANATEPNIPAALAAAVAGVNSLHNFEKAAQHTSLGSYLPDERRLAAASPLFTSGGTPAQYAVTPYDFATIYDLLPLWSAAPTPINGAGQTIAIVGRSDINQSDAKAMWSYFGLDGTHAPQPTLTVTYNGPNPGKTADESEADIDTQWSGAVAPGAKINLVVSATTSSTDGVDLSALYIVDNNLATIVSESYGACEKYLGSAGVQFYGALWQQAAAQGISVFVSTGDTGAAGCQYDGAPANTGLQVNGIAATPYDAAVGGTDFDQYNKWSSYWSTTNNSITKQSVLGYIPEITWNDSCTNSVFSLVGGSTNAETNCNNSQLAKFRISAGSGGGASTSWLKPAWQTGTLSDNARDIPDVSLFASNGFLYSYYLVCQSDVANSYCPIGQMQAFGGTSIGAAQFAGIMALINQKTGSAQGLPGLVLYKLAAQHSSAFHDVPAGSTIATPCVAGSLNCIVNVSGDSYGVLSGYSTATGYDLATGLGSVDVANLVNQWQSVSFNPSTTTLTVNGGSPVNITHGATAPFSVTVFPSAATGEVALMVSPGTPGNAGIASFHLNSGSVNSSTTLFPGGSYSLIAHYGGDSTYGGSYSNSVPINIAPEPSKVFASLVTIDTTSGARTYAASGATYGHGYAILRVDVGDANAGFSSSGISSLCSTHQESCPTGNITLSAPGTPLNGTTLSLNNLGYVELVLPSAGTYSVTASYPGDASFTAASGSTTFTLAKATTALTPTLLGQSIPYGSGVGAYSDISTSSGGVAPGGTIQYTLDGNPVTPTSSFILSSNPYNVTNGVSTYAFTRFQGFLGVPLTVGNHTLMTQYSGDANYLPSTGQVLTFPVVKATAQASLNVPYGGLLAGQSETINAQILKTSFGVTPTGTVTFYDGSTQIPGTVTYAVQPGGTSVVANLVVSYPASAIGDHTISATYSGDSNYAAETISAVLPLVVVGPVSVQRPSVIFVANPGQSGSGTLTYTPNGGYTGAVSLACTPDPKANESSCSFTNGSTTGSNLQFNIGATGAGITFTVTTTAAHPLAQNLTPKQGAMGIVAFAGVIGLFLPLRRRYRPLSLCGLAFAAAMALGACGGGSSGAGSSGTGGTGGGGNPNQDPGTTPGNYSFTVTATTGTGSNAITLTTPISVSVN